MAPLGALRVFSQGALMQTLDDRGKYLFIDKSIYYL